MQGKEVISPGKPKKAVIAESKTTTLTSHPISLRGIKIFGCKGTKMEECQRTKHRKKGGHSKVKLQFRKHWPQFLDW